MLYPFKKGLCKKNTTHNCMVFLHFNVLDFAANYFCILAFT